MRVLVPVLVLAASVTGCAGSRPTPGAAARAAGCEIEVLREGVPSRPTRVVGEVVARCLGAAADDEPRCLRRLQDEACRLGGEVIWAVRSRALDEETREMRATAATYQAAASPGGP